jgi:glutathione S-transferase
MTPVLWGYRYSVYAWIARLVLREKGVAHAWREVDPFAAVVPDDYRALHPFVRVPTLVHGDVAIYETAAITQYVDETFDGPALQPADPLHRARMRQVIGIVDSYGYWPLVRQVFSHGAFRPAAGVDSDVTEVERGLAAAPTVLGALDRLADSLSATRPTLADLHLAPMIGYFTTVPAGDALLGRFPALATWWATMRQRATVIETWPAQPG